MMKMKRTMAGDFSVTELDCMIEESMGVMLQNIPGVPVIILSELTFKTDALIASTSLQWTCYWCEQWIWRLCFG